MENKDRKFGPRSILRFIGKIIKWSAITISILAALSPVIIISLSLYHETQFSKKFDNYSALIKKHRNVPFGGELAREPCRPDKDKIDRKRLSKATRIDIPEFKVTKCIGTLIPSFTGDYAEDIDIEFLEPLSDDIMNQIKYKSEHELDYWAVEDSSYCCKMRWPIRDVGDDRWWTLTIHNRRQASISHGRV